MSNDLELKLRLTAKDQNVAGTVRNTKKEVQGLAGTLGTAAKASKGTAAGMAGITNAGGEANRMFKLQKGAVQQAGYQFQDLAVQIGGGTSAFVAIGQQGSQLLGVLGPGGALMGAVLAIGSVVGGSLVRAFGDGEKAIDALDAAMSRLNETVDESDGIIGLTKQIRDLATESEVAARARIAAAMQDAVNASEAAAKGIAGAFGDLPISQLLGLRDIEDFTESLGMFEAYLQTGYIKDELQDLGEMFGLSGERALEAGTQIGQMLTNLRVKPTVENFRELEDAMGSFLQKGGKPSAELSQFIGDLGTYFDTARDAADRTEYLKKALENLGAATGDRGAADDVKELIEKLQVQAETLGLTTLEMIRYNEQADLKAARDKNAEDVQVEAIKTAYDRIYAYEQEAIATKKAKEAQQEYDRSLASLEARLDPIGTEFAQFAQNAALLEKALLKGDINPERFATLTDNLVQSFSNAGEEAAEKFVNPFEQAAGRVSQAVQQAIASGDWDSLGDAIGNTLAASMSAIVGDQITKSLSKDLTNQSGALAQAGAAFAGPLAGAVVGGAIQLAIREMDDFFSLGDWDPTAMRQAAQGTGTVLGSINEKSQSISKGMDIAASATSELVGINRAMLRALESVQLGIQGASGMIARDASGISFGTPGVQSGGDVFADLTGGVMPVFDKTLELAFDFWDKTTNIFTLGLIDLGSLLGGKSRQVDEGINIVGGYIGDLVDDVVVQSFATFRVKKNVFSSTKTKEKYKNLGDEVTNQFSLVFESVLDSVLSGAEALGIDESAANGFRVGTQKLSLEGMNASQQQEALEAYFGTVFDRLAGYTVPWLDEFQRAGEGLGETLARVATQTQVTQQAVDSLGIRFDDLSGRELVNASQRLVEFGGGLEQFISSMQGFISNFASESQQFVLAQSSLNKALTETGLVLPGTRQGFYDLMQAQNGSTEEGAENIATLLRLQGVADQYYSSLEEQASSLADTQRSMLQEAIAASDSVARALQGLQIDTSARATLRRETALETLRQMTASGSVQPGDRLSDALGAATQINANDFATFSDYIREVSRAGAVLSGLQQVTDNQVTKEQRALESIERRLNSMQQESFDQRRVITQNTAKTARLLERIEVEGSLK